MVSQPKVHSGEVRNTGVFNSFNVKGGMRRFNGNKGSVKKRDEPVREYPADLGSKRIGRKHWTFGPKIVPRRVKWRSRVSESFFWGYLLKGAPKHRVTPMEGVA